MLHLINLCKAYGTQVLFDNASLVVGSGERVGLVGRNGHGKSTLLKFILGSDHPDSGEVRVPAGLKVGHLEQHLRFVHPTVREEVCQALPDTGVPGYREEFKAEIVLTGLGFSLADLERAPKEFSGGYQIRMQLAKLLVSEPDLLLLDEPTNYLDIISIRWLEKFLIEWPGALILITHDRRFMDKVSTHTALIHRQNIRKITGNTEKIYELIAQEEDLYNRTIENEQKKRRQVEKFIERFRAKASKAKQVQSRVKALERAGELKELDDIEELEFYFPEAPFAAKKLFSIENLGFGYKEDLFKGITLSVAPGDRIAVIGPNGKGKSTFLSLLSGDLTPRTGAIEFHPDCKVGYFAQTNISRLNNSSTVEQEILQALPQPIRTRARTICGAMMFSGDLALKKVNVLSGGERARVLLGQILATNTNLLLLDEPTNHLDMHSIAAMVEALERYTGALFIVSHDEELIETLANKLIVFDRGGADIFNGTYPEFLEKIGWAQESEQNDDNHENIATKVSKKDLRKARADRQSTLRPLERERDQIEEQIVALEKQMAELNRELLEITKTGFNDTAAKLSRELKAAQIKIDELFSKLELVESRYQEAKGSI